MMAFEWYEVDKLVFVVLLYALAPDADVLTPHQSQPGSDKTNFLASLP